MLARRDFFVRYRRAAFGLVWAVALPAVQAAVIITVFSHVVRISTQAPYVTFVFIGVVVWTFFSTAVTAASTAIVDGQALASKIYFPRASLPIIAVGSSLIGFVVTLVLLLAVDAVNVTHVGIEILLVAPAAILVVGLALGFGLVNSIAHVYFRDTRFVLQAAMIVWYYITPIFYPLTLVRGPLRAVILVNPVTGPVELLRASLVGADTSLALPLTISCGWMAVLITGGLLLHARFDRLVTDLL